MPELKKKKDDNEKQHQEVTLGMQMPEIELTELIEGKSGRVRKMAQPAPGINIPDITPRGPVGGRGPAVAPPAPAGPPAGGAPPVGNAPAGGILGGPTPGGPAGPTPGGPAPGGPGGPGGILGGPPAPSGPALGGPMPGGLGGSVPGGPGEAPGDPGEAPAEPSKAKLSDKDKEDLLSIIEGLKDDLDNVRNEVNLSVMKDKVIEEVHQHFRRLEDELDSFKRKRIPERKYFDTEGTYRDNLYGMATRMLDEFLPELFDEIPEYNFNTTQVSRTFDDGTVADAIITLMASVPRDGMKYEFKIEIPILNGLMQYPLYIQRGQKIVPLTKAEIQRELGAMSYRKLDFEAPYEKENIFNNIGENTHRRPDDQKWYEVAPNTFRPTSLPPDHILHTQRGKGIR